MKVPWMLKYRKIYISASKWRFLIKYYFIIWSFHLCFRYFSILKINKLKTKTDKLFSLICWTIPEITDRIKPKKKSRGNNEPFLSSNDYISYLFPSFSKYEKDFSCLSQLLWENDEKRTCFCPFFVHVCISVIKKRLIQTIEYDFYPHIYIMWSASACWSWERIWGIRCGISCGI